MKTAVVTGGAAGIGKALVLRLLEHDYNVVCGDIQPITGIPTSLQSRLQYVHCNVVTSDLPSLFAFAVRTFGRIDVVVNNAGIAEPGAFLSDTINMNAIKRVVDINLTAVVEGTRLAIRQFQHQQSPGVVVNVSSMSALHPLSVAPVYTATKTGVLAFTRSLKYLRKRHIRVTAVCPFFVDTNLLQTSKQGHDPVFTALLDQVPRVTVTQVVDTIMQLIQGETTEMELTVAPESKL